MPVVGDPAQTGPGPDRAAARCGQWAGPPGFVLATSAKPAGLASRSGDLQAGTGRPRRQAGRARRPVPRSSRDGTAGGSGIQACRCRKRIAVQSSPAQIALILPRYKR
jgi:hypothetical protein